MAKHPVLWGLAASAVSFIAGHVVAQIDTVAGAGTTASLVGNATDAEAQFAGELANVPAKGVEQIAPAVGRIGSAAKSAIPDGPTATTAAGPPAPPGQGSATPGAAKT